MAVMEPRNGKTVEELVAIIRFQEKQIREREVELRHKSEQARSLAAELLRAHEQIALLRHRLFGRMSEKLTGEDARQGRLFNEAEASADAEAQHLPETETTTVGAHQRKKRGRRPLPADLPREERVHDIPEDEKQCGCGERLQRIGEETSEELELVPARAVVVRHIRPKYACRACEGAEREAGTPAVKIAPPPAKLIPKSIASAGLLAFISVGKFCDGLPFSRQEKQFARIGVELSRQDMSSWIIKVGRACEPLLTLMHSDLRAGPVVGADETRIQVHREPGRENTSESRMWVFRGGPPGQTMVLYQYHPTRSAQVPLRYLSGYRGYLQTDDYSGYDALAAEAGITHVGCWAHARRKFTDAQKGGGKSGSAQTALAFIARLYKAEKELRTRLAAGEISLVQFAALRRRTVVPHLRQMRDWYRERLPQVTPSSLIGKALRYLDHEWPKLLRYLCSPHLSPDNNAALCSGYHNPQDPSNSFPGRENLHDAA